MSSEIKAPKIIDQEFVRIKNRIILLKKIISQGPISYLISIFVSWMVTLEINNGVEKITIQEILKEFKSRIEQLDKMFDEVNYMSSELLNKLNKEDCDETKIRQEHDQLKKTFINKTYKLFNLNDIFLVLIKKCVTFGSGINRILPYLTNCFEDLTKQTIDSILLTNSDEEFENLVLLYIEERVDSIVDPSEKKLKKLSILQSLLKKITPEKVKDNYDIDSMIELNNI
jgi:hypothetical protein